ncbi:hypothetical protein GCK72_018951 [Caenorhabditis remanei]|uniref:T20D4.11-like domain-containing protein n=2 Tax=Caenorhabditis remanei TaxID=31234 RepID=E3M041_CAERE|nr:hypothetical protein GCK72_018951 [Caenorhabditis remanei]EFO87842.1 hypothetical protein CRE_05583 [Caenorhabditis remanei]KAF1752396.1 hypothetical protein GCK72_018951 [Caenorhabditis remanei]
MTNLRVPLVTLSIFFAFTTGTSVDFGKFSNCGILSLREDFKCLLKLVSFNKESPQIDWKNENKLQGIQKSCDFLQSCYESMECRKNDKDTVEIANRMKTYCSSLLHLQKDFSECYRKVERLDSTCRFGDSCNNIFGKNNCARKLILENCGENEWIGFKDNMMRLVKVKSPKCKADQFYYL